jgi:hypothetical protein
LQHPDAPTILDRDRHSAPCPVKQLVLDCSSGQQSTLSCVQHQLQSAQRRLDVMTSQQNPQQCTCAEVCAVFVPVQRFVPFCFCAEVCANLFLCRGLRQFIPVQRFVPFCPVQRFAPICTCAEVCAVLSCAEVLCRFVLCRALHRFVPVQRLMPCLCVSVKEAQLLFSPLGEFCSPDVCH